MKAVASTLAVLLLTAIATPTWAGGYRHHWGHHHHHRHHYHDYGAVLGAVGAGILIYTMGRIHGNHARDRSEASVSPVAYPADGQSLHEQDRDRYECHRWAVDESGFDPTRSRRGDADTYHRAMTACLEARGYVVR